MTDKILVFVTCASLVEASAIARSVVEQRLAACAAVGAPIQSFFTWKGQSGVSAEYPLTLKSRLDRFQALEAEIRRLHSYETPEIIAVPLVGGSAAYLQWMDDCLAPRVPLE